MDTTQQPSSSSSNEQEQRPSTPEPQTQPTQVRARARAHHHHHHNHNHNHHLSGSSSSKPLAAAADLDLASAPQYDPAQVRHQYGDNNTNVKSAPSTTPPPTPPTKQRQQKQQQDGTFSNFQLPNDILKNLTPIAKSPPKDKSRTYLRRQRYIGKVQLKLRAQHNRIDKQIRDCKDEQMRLIQFQSARLSAEFENARSRRDEYLQSIRDRAGRFVRVETLPVESAPVEHVFFASANESGSDAGERKDKRLAQLESCCPRVAVAMVDLQRRCRAVVFNEHIRFIQQTCFLNKFETISFTQVLTVLNSESSIKKSLAYIIQYLKIAANQYEVKSFLYCFIMISDFIDCMQNGSHHPGFNCNSTTINTSTTSGTAGLGRSSTRASTSASTSEETNFYNNCIWVMLYKVSTCMIQEFKKVVFAKQVNAKFIKHWTTFKFIFKIFKWNHLKGIKELLYGSISIADQQLRILQFEQGSNLTHISRQRTKLNLELALLSRYNVRNLEEFNFSDEVVSFTTPILQHIREVMGQLQSNKSMHSFIQNRPNFICFDSAKFHIPEILPLDEWRSFWMSFYFEKYANKRSFPSKLKTGYLGEIEPSSPAGVFNYREMIDSMIDIASLDLASCYEYLYDFYLEFSHVVPSFPNIEGTVPDIFKIQKLIDHFRGSKIGKLFHFDEEYDVQDPTQLKYNIVTQWIKKCQFDKFDEFAKFENLFVIVNSANFDNLKYAIVPQNPNLLFPKFYKILTKIQDIEINEQRALHIVDASCKNRIEKLLTTKPRPNFDAEKFFRNVLCFMIAHNDKGDGDEDGEDEDDYEENEITVNFAQHLKSFTRQWNKLVNTDCLSIMFRAYYGCDIPKKNLSSHLLSLDQIQDANFVTYYKTHSPAIKAIFRGKWLAAMESRHRGAQVGMSGVFHRCLRDIEILSGEISQFTSYLYLVYQPIFNWIYEDLAMP
ncbi:uncharacterized protein LODBEIA_P04220 [Lodderomyces beijingensis]|uniref:Uncharacterized protein n=1 Tax=Lodderomyces beijingensis TaxID=1775926 RepID=A0ABP0ZF50_9ASCO